MASLGLNEIKNFSNDLLVEQSLPLDDAFQSDIYREQEIFPRVGEDYQVEVPELVTMAKYLASIESPENGGLAFIMGQAVTLMITAQEGGCQKQESLEALHDSEASKGSQLEESEGRSLVPRSLGASWNDAEKASFLLALYIFEKNFVRVERFMESKRMGDILAFYYGSFYRSPEYCRWSECRKVRSKRCVYGQKIFTGTRLQELLSRLQPNVSEECKNNLSEVSKLFGEAKMSFEEYVFSLKATVGMSLLVETVGIGKGKRDLTGMVLEHSKSNNAMRPEMPSGKACSSLTTGEIVKFLTGDFRLSKARSNDLFWEAVWPRLLARGWHSEEPKDLVYAISLKNSLVFLVPGIKKFSRRRQVKGTHYFDSVADVLSKVASEPGLIELDDDEDQSKNKEDHMGNSAKLEEDDSPGRRRQYLQPRTPSRASDGMLFTVVDTSLDGKKYTVRELRSLPFENPKCNSRVCIELSDDDTPKVSGDASDDVNTVLRDVSGADNAKASNSLSNGVLVSEGKDLGISAPGPDIDMDVACVDSDVVPAFKESLKNAHLFVDKQPKKALKRQLSRNMKGENSDNIAPVTKKRRRLTACSHGEMATIINKSSVVPSRLELEMTTYNSAPHNSPSQAVSSQDKLSLTSSSRSSLSGSVDCTLQDDSHGAADPQSCPQDQPLIDLNIPPQVPSDFESDILMTYTGGESLVRDDTSHDVTSSDLQSSLNPQRRSTRTRPPTAKALEALANGYLTVSNRPRKKSKGETSRRARGGVGLTEVGAHFMHSMADGSETSASADKERSTSQELQVSPEENRAPTSGP